MPPPDVSPAIATELAARLAADGWTVRKLKAAGFGGRTAELLLGKGDGLPSLDSADRALALLSPPRELWHRPRR